MKTAQISNKQHQVSDHCFSNFVSVICRMYSRS